MRIKGMAAGLILAMTGSAEAAPRVCYQPAEIEADQAILYQTELMVLSDTCKDKAYISFTERNRDTIVTYQHAMIEYFRRSSGKKAELAFESYLTHIANERALHTAQLPPGTACAEGAKLLEASYSVSAAGFRQIAVERAAGNSTHYPLCGAEKARHP